MAAFSKRRSTPLDTWSTTAVVTIGGLHGTVKTIEDTAVVLHVSNGVDLRFEKAAINATASAATLEK